MSPPTHLEWNIRIATFKPRFCKIRKILDVSRATPRRVENFTTSEHILCYSRFETYNDTARAPSFERALWLGLIPKIPHAAAGQPYFLTLKAALRLGT
jgi:hypothetical protein